MGKIIVIAGPTASGKTATAIALAHIIGGEIISADSMQIYQYMDIGTAKPTLNERENIPHHMIDIVKPDKPYSAALYQAQARIAIEGIHSHGKMPILCGGTGFYINAVLRDVDFTSVNDDQSREHFWNIAENKGHEHLHTMLQKSDPAAALNIHPNNVKRVVRALSYYHTTGMLFSKYCLDQKKRQPMYETLFCSLSTDRESLYKRIDKRVLLMFDSGLVDEVAGLLESGYHPNLVSMQGIGYKETVKYITGHTSKPDTIATIQQNSRNYAKRQETWFRNQNTEAFQISTKDKSPTVQALEIAGLKFGASKR